MEKNYEVRFMKEGVVVGGVGKDVLDKNLKESVQKDEEENEEVADAIDVA